MSFPLPESLIRRAVDAVIVESGALPPNIHALAVHGLARLRAFEAIGRFRPSSILDVGCGSGQAVAWAARQTGSEAPIRGIDLDLPSTSPFPISQGDFLTANLTPADLVLALHSVGYRGSDVGELARAFWRATLPQGLVVVDFCVRFPWWHPPGVGPTDLAAAVAIFRSVGFRLWEMRPFIGPQLAKVAYEGWPESAAGKGRAEEVVDFLAQDATDARVHGGVYATAMFHRGIGR